MKTSRIIASEEAKQLTRELINEYIGIELIFHQAGGCCEGSKPSLYKKHRFRLRKNDVCIGMIEGIEFWVDKDLFEYWRHTQFTLEVTDGFGAGGFSLETSKKKSFKTSYTLLNAKEQSLMDKKLKYNT